MDLLGKIKRSPRTIKYLFGNLNDMLHKYIISLRCYLRGRIRVIFLVEYETSCKWDTLYELMLNDIHFEPIIITCPRADCLRDEMLAQLERCTCFFKNKGYSVVKGYDPVHNTYIDVHSLSPDCIFYTNPYDWIASPPYSIFKLSDIYACYISYFFNSAAKDEYFNSIFHKKLWRYYLENDATLDGVKKVCGKLEDKHRVVGYPSFDRVVDSRRSSNKKVIIWAPHHTLNETFGYLHRDGFLHYHDVFIYLAKKYQDSVDFIFRPHPLLRKRLYEREDWGPERTDKYYESWNKLENGRYSYDDDYIELFAQSSAMIHDCVSFTIEYLYFNKPVMFTGPMPNTNHLLETTIAALECHDFAQGVDDIERFIQSIISDDVDLLVEKKSNFKAKYLIPNNGKMASVNILNDLLDSFKICKN